MSPLDFGNYLLLLVYIYMLSYYVFFSMSCFNDYYVKCHDN